MKIPVITYKQLKNFTTADYLQKVTEKAYKKELRHTHIINRIITKENTIEHSISAMSKKQTLRKS